VDYLTHLHKDKKLKKLIEKQEIVNLTSKENVYSALCNSIISQQLSTQVADIIYSRFLNLYQGNEPHPIQIINTPHETLRSIGLSNAKANYVKHVAQFALQYGMDIKTLNSMTNDEIINYLTQIKGVGRWTVEMLLMLCLGREDVFAADDLVIQTAMIKIYKLDALDKKILKQKMQTISQKWSPYRTFACIHLWRYKDTKEIK
jgi:DNA-3-methyladenine glycosylase II